MTLDVNEIALCFTGFGFILGFIFTAFFMLAGEYICRLISFVKKLKRMVDLNAKEKED